VYDERFYKGQPAITENTAGKGKAVYFGVAGCIELIKDYLYETLNNTGIKTTKNLLNKRMVNITIAIFAICMYNE